MSRLSGFGCAALLAGIAASSLAGCACATSKQGGAKPQSAKRVFVTGSHIARRVDFRAETLATASQVRIYTKDDISSTGVVEIGSTLRRLDPSIVVTGP